MNLARSNNLLVCRKSLTIFYKGNATIYFALAPTVMHVLSQKSISRSNGGNTSIYVEELSAMIFGVALLPSLICFAAQRRILTVIMMDSYIVYVENSFKF